MNKILVIDDEPQIRRFLRISLTSQGYEVLEAANGADGLALAATESPQLVVLDLGLPDMDGQLVLSGIREFSNNPVIVLSVRNSEQEKVMALDNGANDYVVKPFGIKEFLARARSLLRLTAEQEPLISNFDDGNLQVDIQKRSVIVAGETHHLSKKEFDLLYKLMMYPGRVVTQQQLLKEIWGESHAQDTHYLRVFIAKLRGKLGDDSSAATACKYPKINSSKIRISYGNEVTLVSAVAFTSHHRI
jgi:two-component system KDP operon response regulator KdpE